MGDDGQRSGVAGVGNIGPLLSPSLPLRRLGDRTTPQPIPPACRNFDITTGQKKRAMPAGRAGGCSAGYLGM